MDFKDYKLTGLLNYTILCTEDRESTTVIHLSCYTNNKTSIEMILICRSVYNKCRTGYCSCGIYNILYKFHWNQINV